MPRSKLSSPPVMLVLAVLLSLILLQHQGTDARSLRSGMPPICYKQPPRSEGICTIEIEGYYYDSISFDCLKYSVGACRLTPGQSFGSQADCVRTCIRGKWEYVN
ncbi:protease inhibitor 1 [Drosophila serrata]|uniref:protease inhibitor 1 n=1 Tax=Drosophila serrata TaxID=7274 RepID=UPI000A1D2E0F|nr:protease inhibitor 1 [Drosophila serrata]